MALIIVLCVALLLIASFIAWARACLLRWFKGVPEDSVPPRQQSWAERQARHNAERDNIRRLNLSGADRIWGDHQDLISKFLEIAERRVSVLDEYGDESWDALPKQILECLLKIGDREAVPRKDIRDWLKDWDGSNWMLELRDDHEAKFLELASRLKATFRVYHDEKTQTYGRDDLNEYSGVDFETYVARVLKAHGFKDICGTPATGDQGADILARRGGRLFVIQVKRHRTKVGNASVQEVAAALKFYDGDEAWVVTNSTFTPAARALAQKTGVRLLEGPDLASLSGESGRSA